MNVNSHIQESRAQGWVLSVCSSPAVQAAYCRPQAGGQLNPAGTGKLLSWPVSRGVCWPVSRGVWVFLCKWLRMAGLREGGLEGKTPREAPG